MAYGGGGCDDGCCCCGGGGADGTGETLLALAPLLNAASGADVEGGAYMSVADSVGASATLRKKYFVTGPPPPPLPPCFVVSGGTLFRRWVFSPGSSSSTPPLLAHFVASTGRSFFHPSILLPPFSTPLHDKRSTAPHHVKVPFSPPFWSRTHPSRFTNWSSSEKFLANFMPTLFSFCLDHREELFSSSPPLRKFLRQSQLNLVERERGGRKGG